MNPDEPDLLNLEHHPVKLEASSKHPVKLEGSKDPLNLSGEASKIEMKNEDGNKTWQSTSKKSKR